MTERVETIKLDGIPWIASAFERFLLELGYDVNKRNGDVSLDSICTGVHFPYSHAIASFDNYVNGVMPRVMRRIGPKFSDRETLERGYVGIAKSAGASITPEEAYELASEKIEAETNAMNSSEMKAYRVNLETAVGLFGIRVSD